MTDTIDFPLEFDTGALDATLHKAIRFTVLDSLDALPDEAGIYVLMGAQPDAAPRPLAFGHVAGSLSRHLKFQPEFAAALRQGFTFAAIAEEVPGRDSARLAERLGRVHNAPINTLRRAVRDIDAAHRSASQMTIAPLAAE
jgi:hypothetical protein